MTASKKKQQKNDSMTITKVKQQVPLTQVRISDGFWSPKLEVYRRQSIPHQWDYVKAEIEDNEWAATGKKKPDGGMLWSQANLHKVMESVANSLAQFPDSELETHADRIIDTIARAQQPDGYCNAYVSVHTHSTWGPEELTPWGHETFGFQHDGYVAGHMIEAAVAYYVATGKRKYLDVARKSADLAYKLFITEGRKRFCAHAGLELALVKLFRVTGDKRYLDLAKDWLLRRGQGHFPATPREKAEYHQDHKPTLEQDEIVGHAVRAIFFAQGIAEVACATGDEALAATARKLWENTVHRKMYLGGGVGTHKDCEKVGADYELPNNGYTESCASLGLMNFAEAMFRLTGSSECGDILEQALYNTVLHGIALDGTHSYYCNPLSDENHPRDNNWTCCPPNLTRTLLGLGNYLYTQDTDTLWVQLFVGSKSVLTLSSTRVTVVQSTSYPWDGAVNIEIDPERPVEFGLRLRVPWWCRNFGLSINGVGITPAIVDGYAVIQREWKKGDQVIFTLDMPVERIEANPKVEADRGRVTLMRGPVVYGLEGLDVCDVVDPLLPETPAFSTDHWADMLGGVGVIRWQDEGRNMLAIPYYAMANRHVSKQNVWLRQAGKKDAPAGWDNKLYRLLQ